MIGHRLREDTVADSSHIYLNMAPQTQIRDTKTDMLMAVFINAQTFQSGEISVVHQYSMPKSSRQHAL